MATIILSSIIMTIVWVYADGSGKYQPHEMEGGALLFRWTIFLAVGGLVCNLIAYKYFYPHFYYEVIIRGMIVYVGVRGMLFNFIWNPRNDLFYAKGTWYDKWWYPFVWTLLVYGAIKIEINYETFTLLNLNYWLNL